MGGLRRLCKAYGGLNFNGVEYLWDYTRDEPRLKSEMTKAEIAASEKAKWKAVMDNYNKHKDDGNT